MATKVHRMVNLNVEDVQYIEANDINLSEKVREWLQRERSGKTDLDTLKSANSRLFEASKVSLMNKIDDDIKFCEGVIKTIQERQSSYPAGSGHHKSCEKIIKDINERVEAYKELKSYIHRKL